MDLSQPLLDKSKEADEDDFNQEMESVVIDVEKSATIPIYIFDILGRSFVIGTNGAWLLRCISSKVKKAIESCPQFWTSLLEECRFDPFLSFT